MVAFNLIRSNTRGHSDPCVRSQGSADGTSAVKSRVISVNPCHRRLASMNTNQVEAKVKKSNASSTALLIRSGDVVIQTEFAELSPCEFPVWASAPVHVEIPPNGAKSFIVGPFSGTVAQKAADGDFPQTIKFPIYSEQGIANTKDFQSLASKSPDQALTKMPIIALATSVSGVVDGKLVQTHCVLPIWNDGSSVLVILDWFEGEPAEGSPNPEWHMRASTGCPVGMGLQDLAQASRLPTNAQHCRYEIHLTPWLLAAQLLKDKGTEVKSRIWQREWAFDRSEEFSNALSCLIGGLTGSGPSSPKIAA